MITFLRRGRRLAAKSPAEWRGRTAQACAKVMERCHLSRLDRLPGDIAAAISADGPAPLPAPSALAGYGQFARMRVPRLAADLIGRADNIVAGRHTVLGLADLSFGDPIDWHTDPVAGVSSPLHHWTRIPPYRGPSVAGDHKVIWEINRHQWFLTLGRAWRLTGDDRYAACFTRNLASWMDANPPKQGVNWTSSLELAYRAIAWIWALRLFDGYPGLTGELRSRACRFLYLHGRHIETYLSTYFSPNTHLTGEALGLVYLGTTFPSWKTAARWRATGTSILMEALGRHVGPDGVYFEQSSCYHRYTTDIYTHVYLLARDTQPQIADAIRPKLVALLEHLMWITRPDATTPLFGDDDGGRLLALDERAAGDFRAALSAGAALFGRADFKHVAGEMAEETFWLLGDDGVAAFDALGPRPPRESARAFPDAGYYVMRDGWNARANWLLADCGRHGAGNCGHAHADALSIQLAARGVTALVDPGTYRYTTSAEDRDAFRSSLAHNTVSVDGCSSSVPGGPFSWRHVAGVRARRWASQPAFDYLEGEHDGYLRLPDPVEHARSILHIRGDYWLVRDRLEARARHRYTSHFQFAPGLSPTISGNLVEVGEGPVLRLWTFGAGACWKLAAGRVSPAYGAAVEAPAADIVVEGSGPAEWLTLIAPGATRGLEPRDEPWGLEMRSARWTDQVLATMPMVGAAATVSGDFDWLWIRHAADASEMVLVAIGPRSVVVAGLFSLHVSEPTDWLSARLSSGALELSLEAGTCVRLVPGSSIRTLRVNGAAAVCRPGTGEVVAV